MGATLRIGRLAGIELRISSTWLIIFALVVYSLGWGVFPDDLPGHERGVYLTMAVAAALAFFASIVVHELAHSLVARRLGIGVESITLFLLGGVATISDEARRARDEFLIAIAGPLASLALGGVFLGVEAGLDAAGAGPEVTRVFFYLGVVNLFLAAFNMLPGFPLDGGRVLRAIVWGAHGDLRTATRVAAIGGRVVGAGLIALGVWEVSVGSYEGLWAMLLGWFVITAAGVGERQTMVRDDLARATAAELMTPNPLGVEPDLTLAQAVDGYFERYPFQVYPVRDVLTPLGLLTADAIRRVDPAGWNIIRVRDVMLPLDGSVISTGDPILDLLPRLRDGARLLVVDGDGDLRGILSASDVSAWLGRRVARRPRPAV
jgi:Zn-dependent protease/CBS domain-containing protein